MFKLDLRLNITARNLSFIGSTNTKPVPDVSVFSFLETLIMPGTGLNGTIPTKVSENLSFDAAFNRADLHFR